MDAVEDHMELKDLNEDCIRHIFQYLSPKDKLNFGKVCLEWKDLSRGIWKISALGVIDFRQNFRTTAKMSHTELSEILLCGGCSLKLVEICLIKNSRLLVCIDTAIYIVNWKLRYYENFLNDLINICRKLKTIKIKIDLADKNLLGKLELLFLVNKELVKLELSNQSNISMDNAMSLLNVHESIEKIKLKWMYKTDDNLYDFIKEKVNLREIKISERDMGLSITRRFLQGLATYTKELRVLHLSGTIGIHRPKIYTGNATKIWNMKNLEEISLQMLEDVMTDEAMAAISVNCKKLKNIRLGGYCCAITGKSTNALSNSLPNLETLYLSGLAINRITTLRLQYKLQTLGLLYCDNLSEEELKKIAIFTNLEELTIDNLRHMTDAVLAEISSCCEKLEKVVLGHCHQITDRGVNTLVTSVPNLKSLGLYSLEISSVSRGDVGLNLQNLTINCCTNISEDALEKSLHMMPKLNTFLRRVR